MPLRYNLRVPHTESTRRELTSEKKKTDREPPPPLKKWRGQSTWKINKFLMYYSDHCLAKWTSAGFTLVDVAI